MPLNRHPWEHLLYAGIGAYCGEHTSLAPAWTCACLRSLHKFITLVVLTSYDLVHLLPGNALIEWEEKTEKEIQEILQQREESNKKLTGNFLR